MTVSEYIFDFLKKKGCTTVFMVSGSSAMWLTDALKRNPDLKAVCCQHEQVAAMAADAVGRVADVPGVCLVTIGPGATNAITGVAGAYVDSSPMFVISGQASSKIVQYQMDSGVRQKGTQSLDLGGMVAGITKYFAVVMEEGTIRFHMEQAYRAAMSGRKGPVWLDIPVDIQNKQVPEEVGGITNEGMKEGSVLPEKDIKKLMQNSFKPLILAGNGILGAHAKADLMRFAQSCQIPIVTSRGGIGVVETGSPLFVGRPGSYGDRASHFAIQECDLLFILGSRLSVSTVGYYPQRFAKNAVKIMVDIDEKELQKEDVPVDIKLQMDVKAFLQAMHKNKWEMKPHEAWVLKCRQNRLKYPVVLPEYEHEDGINSYYFTQELSQRASKDTAVVVDTGSVCNIVSQSWDVKENQDYIISGGLSCMGFWASALGIASQGREVLALAGDGSVQMNIQDFATIAYYRLPVKLFIYNNKGYMLIRHNQHNYMNDRFLGVGPDSGVPSVNFCKVAEAYGIKAVRIEKKEEIKQKIEDVLALQGAVVCEVMVQEFGIIAPRIASRVMPDGSLKAAEFDDLWPFLEGQ
ncbi:MAG: thiamine pyrophosphate-binding protein [Eubacterium sp.]|nr:thiamine pyrophosphate-binding protein [Eubacterium sp.]